MILAEEKRAPTGDGELPTAISSEGHASDEKDITKSEADNAGGEKDVAREDKESSGSIRDYLVCQKCFQCYATSTKD